MLINKSLMYYLDNGKINTCIMPIADIIEYVIADGDNCKYIFAKVNCKYNELKVWQFANSEFKYMLSIEDVDLFGGIKDNYYDFWYTKSKEKNVIYRHTILGIEKKYNFKFDIISIKNYSNYICEFITDVSKYKIVKKKNSDNYKLISSINIICESNIEKINNKHYRIFSAFVENCKNIEYLYIDDIPEYSKFVIYDNDYIYIYNANKQITKLSAKVNSVFAKKHNYILLNCKNISYYINLNSDSNITIIPLNTKTPITGCINAAFNKVFYSKNSIFVIYYDLLVADDTFECKYDIKIHANISDFWIVLENEIIAYDMKGNKYVYNRNTGDKQVYINDTSY